MKRIHYVWHLLTLVLLVAFDQVTKHLARTYLKGNPKILIKDVFSFTYHENTGSIWGILEGRINFFLVISVVLFAVLIYVYLKMPKQRTYFPLLWILVGMTAGAIGNTADRLFFGYVTDFIYFELINFPIFNLADCYITVTAILTILLILTKYREDEFAFLSLKRKDRGHADKDSDEA